VVEIREVGGLHHHYERRAAFFVGTVSDSGENIIDQNCGMP
jgi:hypothetical protein